MFITARLYSKSKMKNGKAEGTDEIPAEALKVDPEMLVEMLYGLFAKIWEEEEEILLEWKEGLLIKIPKKGHLGLHSNYRGITLLSMPEKVLNRVLLERLKGSASGKRRDGDRRELSDLLETITSESISHS